MAFNTTEADMPWLDLPGGFMFTLEAVSPTTGAAVAGVNVSSIAVYGEDLNLGELLTDEVPEYTALEVVDT